MRSSAARSSGLPLTQAFSARFGSGLRVRSASPIRTMSSPSTGSRSCCTLSRATSDHFFRSFGPRGFLHQRANDLHLLARRAVVRLVLRVAEDVLEGVVAQRHGQISMTQTASNFPSG